MGNLFHTLLYQPLFNLLVFLYEYVAFENMGIAVILLTVITRLVLWPLFYKSTKSQMVMQKLQPKIKELQKKYKDDRQKQAEELMALYREHEINPFGSFGLLLVQLPIIFAVYRVFLRGFGDEVVSENLYSFMPQISDLHHFFFGLDLNERSVVLAIVVAVVQYYQVKTSMGRIQQKRTEKGTETPPAEAMTQKMMYIMPGIAFAVLWSLPSVVGIYWFTSTVMSILQQYMIHRALDGAEEAAA